MKILVVSATDEEIMGLKEINLRGNQAEFLVTGPGMVATAYHLTKHLLNYRYDLAINCGIAGSFDRNISIGDTVSVIEDVFSELGAQDGTEFLTLDDIGLKGVSKTKNTFSSQALGELNIKEVRGVTINTVHGEESSIEKVKARLNPKVESMEGAAFFYVCEMEKIPSLQIRTISNYIERRNKSAWNIPLALSNLKSSLERILSSI